MELFVLCCVLVYFDCVFVVYGEFVGDGVVWYVVFFMIEGVVVGVEDEMY